MTIWIDAKVRWNKSLKTPVFINLKSLFRFNNDWILVSHEVKKWTFKIMVYFNTFILLVFLLNLLTWRYIENKYEMVVVLLYPSYRSYVYSMQRKSFICVQYATQIVHMCTVCNANRSYVYSMQRKPFICVQ